MNTIISPENKLATILAFDTCKTMVEQAIEDNDTCVILCPNYSINIASKYDDCEELQYDLDELSEYIGGYYVEVSQFDDLVVNFISEY